MMNYDTCDFEGCEQPLADWQPKSGAKLCEEHSEEFERLAEEEKVKEMVSFGIKTMKEGRKRLK